MKLEKIFNLVCGTIKNIFKFLDLGLEIHGVIANKKTTVVNNIRIDNVSHCFIVEVTDYVMAKKATPGDDSKFYSSIS